MSQTKATTIKENNTRKNLNRPRLEKQGERFSTCVSVGMPGTGSSTDNRMQWSGKTPSELWGRKK